MAKQKQGAGGDAADEMAKYQQMMKDAMANPDEYLAQLGEMGDQFGQALEEMMKLSPEEIQQQMEMAMKMMTDGDIVENVINQKDEIIASLEASGAVPPEEIAKYKADPNYFELKMRETFDQMGSIMSDPEYLEKTTEVMKNMASMMQNPEQMEEMMKMVGSEFQDDDKIEEARLQVLAGQGGMAGLSEMFDSPEMQEILKDPVKWRETVREGMSGILGGGGGGGGIDPAKAEL